MTEFDLLIKELLKEFCDNPDPSLGVDGFRDTSSKVSMHDKDDFVRAIRAGLVRSVRSGLYRAPQSCASEQFFWSGRKSISPRRITLWLEPIITVATLARLHFELGWPPENLGTQSLHWGFDLCAYEEPLADAGPATSAMVIAGVIKKSRDEIEDLLDLMTRFGAGEKLASVPTSRERNAHRKVDEIRRLRARYFWAVGPDRMGHAFAVRYGPSDEIQLDLVPEGQLRFLATRGRTFTAKERAGENERKSP